MEQPLVSVITITRNRGKLLGRCIRSVLGQTYKNIEHIIVDGASDDNTDEVVASFQDSRLIFIKLETNWSIVDTINHGVGISTGKYISFLDSDDEYVPTKIEKQVDLIQSLPDDYGMVYCGMIDIDATSGAVIERHQPSLRGNVYDESIGVKQISGTPTFMFRRAVFEHLGGWKDDIGIISDWELAVRCCRDYKVDFVPEELVRVYVNHGSIRQSDNNYYADVLDRRIKFCRYFLSEFYDVFERHPKYASEFYYSICISAFQRGKFKEACRAYTKLLSTSMNLKYIISPLIALKHKIYD